MSSLERRVSSWALSLFDELEENTQTRTRIIAAAIGTVVTILLWVVHLSYPYILHDLIESDDWAKLSLGFLLAPPFVVAFSIGSLIFRQVSETAENESGPMSGYFYKQRADKRARLLIIAGIVGALNLMLMIITSY